MGEPFRFRRFKVQGFLFTPIYLAVTVGGAAAMLLLDEPQKRGFNRAHSVAIVVAMWVAVFGGMTLISALILALYYRGRFSVQRKQRRIEVGLSDVAIRRSGDRAVNLDRDAIRRADHIHGAQREGPIAPPRHP